MENDIKKLITKNNVQLLSMVGLLITSFQFIFLLIKQVIINKK
jgi:hypothetical protein